jgi:hypothetical protein
MKEDTTELRIVAVIVIETNVSETVAENLFGKKRSKYLLTPACLLNLWVSALRTPPPALITPTLSI